MMRGTFLMALLSILATNPRAIAQMNSPSPIAAPVRPTATPYAATPDATPAATSLVPGTIIRADNAARFASFIPAAAMLAIKHGFQIEVTPTRRLQWSRGFQTATEKYSPQVGLDHDDYLTNYIAGMPFPLLDATDPHAAVKIAYNWHLGPVLPDDFSLAPWSSNGYLADQRDPTKILPSNDADDQCAQFDFVRYAHRTEVEPRPSLDANASGVEWKARCNQWTTISVGANGEGAGIWIRYMDPRVNDDFYAFSQESRRIRRMGIHLAYPDQTCRKCHQPYWAYALPKTEIYTYRLLGTTPILACMETRDEPAGIAARESGYALTKEPFELRHAYILEMTPKKADLAERTIIFIDSEIYVWLAAEFYQSGERVATAIPLWRTHPSPEGGNLFDLAGSFYFPADQPGFIRSLVPAHSSFTQRINTGSVSASDFNPNLLSR